MEQSTRTCTIVKGRHGTIRYEKCGSPVHRADDDTHMQLTANGAKEGARVWHRE